MPAKSRIQNFTDRHGIHLQQSRAIFGRSLHCGRDDIREVQATTLSFRPSEASGGISLDWLLILRKLLFCKLEQLLGYPQVYPCLRGPLRRMTLVMLLTSDD